MRSKDPEKMREIIAAVDDFYEEHHRSPSVREIAAKISLNRSAVYNYLVAMRDSGMIDYDGQTVLTPSRREAQGSFRRVGVVGTVSCGLPADPAEIQDDYLTLPVSMTGRHEIYVLYAEGLSMTGAGIDPGDMVLVRRAEEARTGDIVVAWVEGEGNTLKRFVREGRDAFLHPENPDFDDIRGRDFKIQGVAVWVFKKVG